jgi:hypothetical protein
VKDDDYRQVISLDDLRDFWDANKSLVTKTVL